MTAICPGGGASGPKPGVAEVLIFGADLLAQRLATTGNAWLEAAAALLGVLSYDSISGCAADPPALPTFTQNEQDALLGIIPGTDLLNAFGKLKDTILNGLWYTFCACNVGPQPAAPLPIPPPTNISTPPILSLCGSVEGVEQVWSDTVPTQGNAHSLLGQISVPAGSHAYVAGYPLVGGATQIGITPRNAVPNNPGGGCSITIGYYNAANANVGNSFTGAFQPPTSPLYTIPAGATQIIVWAENSIASNDSFDITASIRFYCGSGPGSIAPDCCPPDPTLSALVLQIWQQVNLIQRQHVPFAYIPGAVHAGLAGAGTIAVSGLLGVKALVTASPVGNRTLLSEPPYIYDLGWLSMLTGDGLIDEKRLHALAQVWVSPLASEATVLGYYFRPGVTVTLTELKREP